MIDDLKKFAGLHCVYPHNYCNGDAIPNDSKSSKMEPCLYYDIEKGCTHRHNPKNRKRNGEFTNEKANIQRIR